MARFKFLSIAILVLAYLAFSTGVKADTTYTYVGNPYNFCDGTYVCTGTSPVMQITFSVSSGTSLSNLPFTDIASAITSFSITDGQSAPLTILFTGSGSGAEISTDTNGNIVQWVISDTEVIVSSLDGSVKVRTFFSGNVPGMSGDFSASTFSQGPKFTEGSGGGFPMGTWTVSGVTEPSSVLLLGVGIVGLMGLSLRRGR